MQTKIIKIEIKDDTIHRDNTPCNVVKKFMYSEKKKMSLKITLKNASKLSPAWNLVA